MNDEERTPVEQILSQLEQELFIDTASIEYYITMPFDERLELLLEEEAPTVAIETGGVSSYLRNHKLFPPNTIEPVEVFLDEDTPSEVDVEAFSFKLKGSMRLDHKKISINAEVTSDLNDGVPTFIQDVRGANNEFIVLRSTDTGDGFIHEMLDTVGLIHLLGSFADIDRASMANVLKQATHDGKLRRRDLHILLMNTWSLIGYKMGSKKETKMLSHTLPKESDMYSESIKLERQEEQNQTEDLLRFTLERTKTFEGLDVEDTYSLKLEFSSDPQKAEHTILNQMAERIIASGITPLTLVGVSGSRIINGGKKTELNLNDIEVITQFVDWFDQLITA